MAVQPPSHCVRYVHIQFVPTGDPRSRTLGKTRVVHSPWFRALGRTASRWRRSRWTRLGSLITAPGPQRRRCAADHCPTAQIAPRGGAGASAKLSTIPVDILVDRQAVGTTRRGISWVAKRLSSRRQPPASCSCVAGCFGAAFPPGHELRAHLGLIRARRVVATCLSETTRDQSGLDSHVRR